MLSTSGRSTPLAISPAQLAELGCRRHLAQQREQWLRGDQLADRHQLSLHVVRRLLARIGLHVASPDPTADHDPHGLADVDCPTHNNNWKGRTFGDRANQIAAAVGDHVEKDLTSPPALMTAAITSQIASSTSFHDHRRHCQ